MESDNSNSSGSLFYTEHDERHKSQKDKRERDSAEVAVKLEKISVNEGSSDEEKDQLMGQDEAATSVVGKQEVEDANDNEEVQVLKEVRSRKRNKRKVWTGKKRKVQKKVKVEEENLSKPKGTRYIYRLHAKEDHGRTIYGIDFYHGNGMPNNYVFATCGTNRVTIYECTEDLGLPIKPLQCFEDPDPNEEFFCCSWSDDSNGMPILAVAGERGIIRIFSPSAGDCIKNVVGHTASVNHLTFHPKDPNLMFSASKDQSCRLWNLKTDVLVAIFGGYEGHRDQILFVDVDMIGSKIITTGIDHAIMVWKLDKPEIKETILKSYTFQSNVPHRPFKTCIQGIPGFFTRDIHSNYVDCARWFGDLIFSKCCEKKLVCWKAGDFHQKWDEILISKPQVKKISEIARLTVKKSDIWFIRFSIDFWKHYLALGNNDGKIFLYDLTVEDPEKILVDELSHPLCEGAVRQTAFSRDGKILIGVCDDSTVWRWDRNENYVREKEQKKEEFEKEETMEKDSKEETMEQANKETMEQASKEETMEQANKETMEQVNKETMEQANKETMEQANKETMEQANKETMEQANKETMEQANKETMEQANKETMEQANKEIMNEVNKEETMEEASKEETMEEASKEETMEEANKEETMEEANKEESMEEANKEETMEEANNEETMEEVN